MSLYNDVLGGEKVIVQSAGKYYLLETDEIKLRTGAVALLNADPGYIFVVKGLYQVDELQVMPIRPETDLYNFGDVLRIIVKKLTFDEGAVVPDNVPTVVFADHLGMVVFPEQRYV